MRYKPNTAYHVPGTKEAFYITSIDAILAFGFDTTGKWQNNSHTFNYAIAKETKLEKFASLVEKHAETLGFKAGIKNVKIKEYGSMDWYVKSVLAVGFRECIGGAFGLDCLGIACLTNGQNYFLNWLTVLDWDGNWDEII